MITLIAIAASIFLIDLLGPVGFAVLCVVIYAIH